MPTAIGRRSMKIFTCFVPKKLAHKPIVNKLKKCVEIKYKTKDCFKGKDFYKPKFDFKSVADA
jgi:hypothetical protein